MTTRQETATSREDKKKIGATDTTDKREECNYHQQCNESRGFTGRYCRLIDLQYQHNIFDNKSFFYFIYGQAITSKSKECNWESIFVGGGRPNTSHNTSHHKPKPKIFHNGNDSVRRHTVYRKIHLTPS